MSTAWVRCIVVSPRHDFIRPWIRAYFSTGNTIPLVIVPGPPGDWRGDDMEYCRAAAEYSGGLVFNCADVWKDCARLADRAVDNKRGKIVGWYTKKGILHAVASRLAPKSWAWIDDDAEVTGNLDGCFEYAEKCPGFICAQFYYPSSIDNCHAERMFRMKKSPGEKLCWNSLVFFHGDANKHLSEELCKDFPIEDDEIVFGDLYKQNPVWHDGFCDFSIRGWQATCKLLKDMPRNWSGKIIHYTAAKNDMEVKKYWAAKASKLPPAPFEKAASERGPVWPGDPNEPIDAVFVIGTQSVDNNKELRYALRNLEKNCKFVRNVYICGFCPTWVDKTKVKHLQWPDRFEHAKDANIIDKLRHACETPGIAKRILFCSDDQFQTRECAWEDFQPRYLRVFSEKDGWYENKHRVWHTRLRKTMLREVQRRVDSGLDPKKVYYYQPHIWMPIDRDMFVEYAKWCGYDHRDDTIIAAGYFNYANVDGKPDFGHQFLGGGDEELTGTTHVAYHDGSYRQAIAILEKMFPKPSRFELDGGAGAKPRPAPGPAVNKVERPVAPASPVLRLRKPEVVTGDARNVASDKVLQILRERISKLNRK